mgnify:CR=1 FL=1
MGKKEATKDAVSALTPEQQEKLDFTPTEAELAYVDHMATNVTSELKSKRSFNGRRNRDAWNRMNRPTKVAANDKGADMINRLIDKGLKLSPVPAYLSAFDTREAEIDARITSAVL